MDFTNDLRVIIKTEKNLLVAIGCYPRQDHKISYLFGVIVNLCLNFLQWIPMMIQIIIGKNDLFTLSETVEYFVTCGTFTCKFVNFHLNGRQLLDIEETLLLPVFYDFPEDRLRLLHRKIVSCRLVATTFRVLCALAVLAYSLFPVLDRVKFDTLPYPSWYPYNTTKYYYHTYTFQMVGISLTAYTNSTLDVLNWTLITIASGQFEILKESLKNINYTKGNRVAIEEEFRKCVRHHSEIVKLVYKIERMFSRGIFLQFFCSMCVICFVGFLLIIVPFPSMQFGFLAMYFSCMFCQIAMYCWCGNDIIQTSRTITDSFYMSNWYDSDTGIRKDMSVFLERIKKPTSISAGGYITLSLTTLTAMLRSSYSYLAVLNHLYKKS